MLQFLRVNQLFLGLHKKLMWHDWQINIRLASVFHAEDIFMWFIVIASLDRDNLGFSQSSCQCFHLCDIGSQDGRSTWAIVAQTYIEAVSSVCVNGIEWMLEWSWRLETCSENESIHHLLITALFFLLFYCHIKKQLLILLSFVEENMGFIYNRADNSVCCSREL